VAAHEAEVREELRTLCRTRTYFLAKVLGFDKLSPTTHHALCDFMDRSPRRALVLAPRSTFKSTIGTITDIVRMILNQPDIRILLVSISQDNACNLLSVIKAQFERNVTLRWLFPELLPDFAKTTRWNKTEMCVRRDRDWPEATVEAIGVQSTVVSRHYDVIKNDDLVDQNTAESPAELARALEFYKTEESLLVSPRAGRIQTIGTRWHFHDPYDWILKHEEGVEVFQRGVYNPDGTLYFPEQLPEEEIVRLRAKYGTFLFSALYENNPCDPDAGSFRESWLRWHKVEYDVVVPDGGQPIPLEKLRVVMRVDPAISEARTAARTAIVVDGVAPDGRKFLLDVWAKRCQPSDMFDAIFSLYQRWGCQAVGVESVAYQRAIQHFLAEEARRRDRWLNIVELRPDTRKSKEARIRAVQPYLERGEISVSREHREFLDEYRTFPMGSTVDVLDAWAYGPVMWEPPLEAEESDSEAEEWGYQRALAGANATTGY